MRELLRRRMAVLADTDAAGEMSEVGVCGLEFGATLKYVVRRGREGKMGDGEVGVVGASAGEVGPLLCILGSVALWTMIEGANYSGSV